LALDGQLSLGEIFAGNAMSPEDATDRFEVITAP
jgi:hypothetical protein